MRIKLFILPILLSATLPLKAGIPVIDVSNIMQAKLLYDAANSQLGKLGDIFNVNGMQLSELENIYNIIGDPKSVGNLDYARANETLSKMGIGLPDSLNQQLGGVVDNFLGMNLSDFKDIILSPKKEIGNAIMKNISSKIGDRMGLPVGATANMSDYLKSYSVSQLSAFSDRITTDIANYYYAQYSERAETRSMQTATLTAKNSAISEEIRSKVSSGDVSLNQQMVGMNELQSTQNEILLNTSVKLEEANTALINSQNATKQTASALQDFERQRERIRRLNRQ